MKRLRGRADVTNATVDFDDVRLFLEISAHMSFLGEDIQPAVGPVRRILGLYG